MKKIAKILIFIVLLFITVSKPILTYVRVESLYNEKMSEEIHFSKLVIDPYENEDISDTKYLIDEENERIDIEARIKFLYNLEYDDVNFVDIKYSNVNEKEISVTKDRLLEEIQILMNSGVIPKEDIDMIHDDIELRKITYANIEKPKDRINIWEAYINVSDISIYTIFDGDDYVIYEFSYYDNRFNGNNVSNDYNNLFFEYLGLNRENMMISESENEELLLYNYLGKESEFVYYCVNRVDDGSNTLTIEIILGH